MFAQIGKIVVLKKTFAVAEAVLAGASPETHEKYVDTVEALLDGVKQRFVSRNEKIAEYVALREAVKDVEDVFKDFAESFKGSTNPSNVFNFEKPEK